MKASRRPRPRTGLALSILIELVFCAWWIVTLLSQHAQRTFDRLRPLDRIGLVIPNWRFFAPEPAVHDFHLLYRTRDSASAVSEWADAFSVEERRWRHAVWFPARRREKAVFDVCIDLMGLGARPLDQRSSAPSHRLVANAVRRMLKDDGVVDVQDFQFMLVLFTGYEESGSPDYRFVSAPVPFEETADVP
ncbi:hypothetical protein ACFY5A_04530 [Microbacterium sp. NPDC012755]|uniref:hypothetical protein n=1 Tax=Microbacterium sp. NPDC012755 TaxID=3364184 RepID=UPI0036A5079C